MRTGRKLVSSPFASASHCSVAIHVTLHILVTSPTYPGKDGERNSTVHMVCFMMIAISWMRVTTHPLPCPEEQGLYNLSFMPLMNISIPTASKASNALCIALHHKKLLTCCFSKPATM